jgi:hypothetical protein
VEAETLEEVATLVRTGCYSRERLEEIFLEEMYAPGDLDPDEVAEALDRAIDAFAREREGWPEVTDCDRLDRAFAAIGHRGVIALHNAGNTQSDGYDDFRQAFEEASDQSAVLGFCFYHGQDLEGVVRGGGLRLSFGPTNPDDEATKGPEVGRIVREELERAGLKVQWSGKLAERIYLPDISWKRRPADE